MRYLARLILLLICPIVAAMFLFDLVFYLLFGTWVFLRIPVPKFLRDMKEFADGPATIRREDTGHCNGCAACGNNWDCCRE